MSAQTVVCVGAVVMNSDSLLIVRQAKGHSLAGQWTIPWGRLEAGESPSLAAVREAKEEGGVSATIDGLLGVQELSEPWAGWLGIIYLCHSADRIASPDGWETDAARFVTVAQLDALGEPIEPWSEWMIRRVLAGDYSLAHPSPDNPFIPSAGFFGRLSD